MNAALKGGGFVYYILLLVFCLNQPVYAINDTLHRDSIKTILFVGNSLIYTNDLPAIVARIGKTKGVEIKIKMLAYPDYALEDHWNDGELQKALETNQFDFIVVQQGPSSQDDGRLLLIDYGTRISALAKKHKVELAFFMVWPAFSNFENFDKLIKNYTDAAIKTNVLLCPVGKVWKEYILRTKDYSYYGPDMFHPSQKGSEIAAAVIYETIFNPGK